MQGDLRNNCGAWPLRWAERRPTALALVDEHRRLSWQALERRIAGLCGWMNGHGVELGDRVALILPNGTPYLEIVLACARLGAIAVPVNTRSTVPELEFVCADAEPKLWFHASPSAREPALRGADPAAQQWLARMPARRLAVGGDADDAYEQVLAGATPRHDVAAVGPGDPMILMYTSGTTGHPKGALLPHRKTLYNCLNAQLYFGIRGDDRVLVPAPLFHSLALQILALPAIYAGARVVVQRTFDAAAVWQAVASERITYVGGVPTMYQRLHEWLERVDRLPEAGPDTSSLRFLFTAGAAIPVELIRSFERRGLCLKQGYGQTETSTLTCLDEADAVRKAGSVGRPVFHAELRLVDPASIDHPVSQWRDVTRDETGEIVVRGPIAMTGYWRRPAETAEVLREDGWLRTGDLATLDGEGFVTLVGRAREMFISGGENVYPAEIEAVYREHPEVREIAVVGVPDERWGEAGRAYVVLTDASRLDTAGLRAWATGRIAGFKIPREFVALPALPHTASGKVQKHRLGEAS